MAKILIIEDETALLTMLSDKLKKEGYDVATAEDGEEGLQKIKEENPDLILLDIIMPKMGGMEVLEIVHEDDKMSKIPIIIISNSGQPVEIERAKALGIRDYLIKAEFEPQEVVGKVRAVLEETLSESGNVPEEKMPEGTDTVAEKIDLPAAGKSEKGSDAGKEVYRVLVVEDDQFLRELIIKKLEEEGLSTMQAIDGEEGLRLVAEKKPDIVLLDLILPGIDGFEVLKQIKGTPDISDIPVVILSNLGQKDDIERGLELGANDYLIKAHFTPGEIVQKVKEILG